MNHRTDITDIDGTPRAIAELDADELRALRLLADAGLISPLAGQRAARDTDSQGVLIEQDFTRGAGRVPANMTKNPYRKAS